MFAYRIVCVWSICVHALRRLQSVTTNTTNAFLWPLIEASQQQDNSDSVQGTAQIGNESLNVTHESPSSTVDEHSSHHKNGNGTDCRISLCLRK